MTLLVLPEDQVFTVYIYSNADQEIRIAYVQYSPEKLRADVRYVYYDTYAKGEGFPEVFDPATESKLTEEELRGMGVMVTEPWSGNIVYSPTAIRQLTSPKLPHPSPIVLLVILLVIFVLLIIVLILIIKLIVKLMIRLFRKPEKEKAESGSNSK